MYIGCMHLCYNIKDGVFFFLTFIALKQPYRINNMLKLTVKFMAAV